MRACFMLARVLACFMNERERERERGRKSLACGRAINLQGCAHPLHRSERKRESEKKERKKERERKREKERERKKE